MFAVEAYSASGARDTYLYTFFINDTTTTNCRNDHDHDHNHDADMKYNWPAVWLAILPVLRECADKLPGQYRRVNIWRVKYLCDGVDVCSKLDQPPSCLEEPSSNGDVQRGAEVRLSLDT